VKKKSKTVPPAVSAYMASMAHRANKALQGTETARKRASIASRTRWNKQGIPAETAAAIRAMRATGQTLRSVAQQFGVSESSVSKICSRTRHKPSE
jgi:DNA invertase Pin-like site-specific DNA recombinase